MQATISRDQMQELKEAVEDSIQYVCDQEMISGEAAWTIVECLATAKIAQLQGLLD